MFLIAIWIGSFARAESPDKGSNNGVTIVKANCRFYSAMIDLALNAKVLDALGAGIYQWPNDHSTTPCNHATAYLIGARDEHLDGYLVSVIQDDKASYKKLEKVVLILRVRHRRDDTLANLEKHFAPIEGTRIRLDGTVVSPVVHNRAIVRKVIKDWWAARKAKKTEGTKKSTANKD